MRTQQLEGRVMDIVDHVLDGGDNEDDLTEFKSKWPASARATARQIAGLANRGAGEPVMWIVGIDEGGHCFADGESPEIANWWPGIVRCFDAPAPEMAMLRVHIQGHVVTVLQFDTSRAPYMVATDGRGGIEREIPWREGNQTRSARRSEVLRSLLAEVMMPTLELVSGAAAIEHGGREGQDRYGDAELQGDARVWLRAKLLAYVEVPHAIILPSHRWSATVRFGENMIEPQMDAFGPYRIESRVNSSSPVREARWERHDIGQIQSGKGSGLMIGASDSTHVRLTWDDTEGGAISPEAARHAQVLALQMDFPIATIGRTARLSIRLRRVAAPTVILKGQRKPLAVFTHDRRPVESSGWTWRPWD